MLSHPLGWIVTSSGLFFLLLILVILTSPIKIYGHVRKIGEDEDATFRITALYGIIRYRYVVPLMNFTGHSVEVKKEVSRSNAGVNTWAQYNDEIDAERVEKSVSKFNDILKMTRNLTGWATKSMARVSLLDWRWSTVLGTGDAMWTAMATGAVWSVKTTMIGLLSQMLHLKAQPVLTVSPIFQCPTFSTEWSCIAQIRFGYAILAGLQLLVRMNRWKGGVKAWQNILFKA